jgi:predicted DsbA family dithiol-disulfide isomerase
MLTVEIWSDVVCPWCYLGKRRFESALEQFPHRDQVQVRWRSFQLDPSAPAIAAGSSTDRLAAKIGSRERAVAANQRLTALGAAEGLTYRFDTARPGNTFDAHRLLHLAAAHGVQEAAEERLFRGYFTDGEPVGDRDTLVRLLAEVGIDRDEASAVLEGGRYADEVEADGREAMALGSTGVPFFVIDRRYAVAGAQPAEVLLSALERAWAEGHGGFGADASGSPADTDPIR